MARGNWAAGTESSRNLDSEKDVEDARWSAWGNRKSFWIEKGYLLRSLLSAGFDCVYEQFDYIDEASQTYWEERNRSMFVAIKLPEVSSARG